MSYRVRIKRSAEKEMRSLPKAACSRNQIELWVDRAMYT
jgi:mRNA-degrading endonuclease RelE of RelBE toxin-antitoxin system